MVRRINKHAHRFNAYHDARQAGQTLSEEDSIQEEQHKNAAIKVTAALASILLHKSNHERLHSINGLPQLVKIMKKCEGSILATLSQVLVSLTPAPEDLLR